MTRRDEPLACWEKQLLTGGDVFLCALPTGHDGDCQPHPADRIGGPPWDQPGADPFGNIQEWVRRGREHLPGGTLHRMPSPPWICRDCDQRLTAGESLAAPDLDADGSRCYFCTRPRADLRVLADPPPMSKAGAHWFADVDEAADAPYVWQPCLDTGDGLVPHIEIWFDSKERCEEWIRKYLIGAPLDADLAERIPPV